MKQIKNLEELTKGDFVMVYYKKDFKTFRSSKRLVGEVEAQNDNVLHIKGLKEHHDNWEGGGEEEFIDKKYIILKTQEKVGKKKLRQKKKSFNKDYVIFKLSPPERSKIIREAILDRLK